MTVRHHPSDETLLRYASGSLSAGLRMVVAAHIEGCPACRSHVADLEAVGGAMLSDLPPAPMAEGAIAAALLALDRQKAVGASAWRGALKAPPGGVVVPRSMRACEIGEWRAVAPGVRLSRVLVPGDPRAKVILLRVKAGRHMPRHRHTGFEFTHVLSGSFSDSGAQYLPGDFVEGDSETEHAPVIGAESECISLAAIDGQIRFHGLVGRLLQPFLGI